MKKFNDLLRKAKFNNTGSTLVVVAVCVMFIGILAVTMLMTSYMNYQMKITDRLSTVNFHSAEGALDQASAGLKVQSEKSLEEAFDYAEKYYAATPQKERTNLINKRYVTEYFGKLASAAGLKNVEKFLLFRSRTRKVVLPSGVWLRAFGQNSSGRTTMVVPPDVREIGYLPVYRAV